MVTQWIILLSVASLAFGVMLRDDAKLEGVKKDEEVKKVEEKEEHKHGITEEQIKHHINEHVNEHIETIKKENNDDFSLAALCCKIDRIVPSLIKKVPAKCYKSIAEVNMNKSIDPNVKVEKNCLMFECILDHITLINEDKSIKEAETKTYLTKNVAFEMKDVLTNSLNRCFVKHNANQAKEKSDTCKSRSGELFGCLIGDVLRNCPKSMWQKLLRPECRSTKKTKKATQ